MSDSKDATRFAKYGYPENPQKEGQDRTRTPVAPSRDGQQQYQVTGPDHLHFTPETAPRAGQPSLARRIVTMSAKAGSSGKRPDSLW